MVVTAAAAAGALAAAAAAAGAGLVATAAGGVAVRGRAPAQLVWCTEARRRARVRAGFGGGRGGGRGGAWARVCGVEGTYTHAGFGPKVEKKEGIKPYEGSKMTFD